MTKKKVRGYPLPSPNRLIFYKGPDMTEQEKIRWKEKVNLYRLIQKKCDRPAYFWRNFRVQPKLVPDLLRDRHYSIEEYINKGEAFALQCGITIGYIDPQKWCDEN